MEYTKADLQQLTSEKLLEIYNFVQQLVGGKVLKKFKNKAVAVELTFEAMGGAGRWWGSHRSPPSQSRSRYQKLK